MARSRWELEEKKKKKALEAVKQAAQAGTAYRAPKTAQEAAKAATGTVISRPAQKSATSSRSAAAAAPAKAAPTAQKQSGFRSLAKLPETVKRTAAPTVAAAQQRASDRSRLQENMLAWHGADTAGRRALEQENAAIRGRLGLEYNAGTGVTYDPQTGKNYSLPTQLAFGQDAGRRARTASQYPTSREFAGQGADSVSLRPNMQELAAGVGEEAKGANAHRVLEDLFRRSGEAWTERDRENRDAAVLALQDEMARILSRYGLRYSVRTTGPNARFLVTDRNAAERLRQAGADADEIAYIEENIALREGTHRIRQGAEAAGKGFAGGIASLGENIAQNYENWQENQQNPEYRAAQDELRQIETRIGLTPRQNADGTMNSEYAALEQRAEELRAKMLLVSDTGRVDPDAWGQRMLREAGQAQENATAGLAPVPRFLAGQGISIAQNLPAMGAAAIPVVGPAAAATMMGAGAAGQRAYELNQRADVSPGEALRRGLVSGAVEAATEKFPLDAWAELLTRGGTGMVKNLLRQMGIEATEEGASYVLNYAADRAAGDPKAAFSFQELAENAIGGAVSGLFFGTAGTLAGRARRSTSVDTNPATHTPEQMAKINEYVDAVDEGLLEFVQQTAAGETTGTYQLENVSDRAAHDIHAITGIDATGFQTKIEPRMIRHIIARHGANGNADHSMADANDIARIQYVLNNYDQMLDGGYSNAYKEPNPNMPGRNRNARTVVYVKKINGSYYVVEAVPVSRQKTAFITSTYMQKGDQPILNAPNNAPGSTSENASLNLLNNNIAQNGVDGNGMDIQKAVQQAPDAKSPGHTSETALANTALQPAGSIQNATSAPMRLYVRNDSTSPVSNSSIAQNGGDGNGTGANNGSADQLLSIRLQLPEAMADDAPADHSIASESGNGNSVQELTARLAGLDAEKRAAEGALPGPARDARIAALQEEIERVSGELALRQGLREPETVSPETVETPLSAAIQYGKTPEQAAMEAKVKETGRLRSALRDAHRHLVSGQAELERLARVQDRVNPKAANANDLAQLNRAANSTVDTIAGTALVDRKGDAIGESWKEIIEGLTEEQLEQLTLYRLHRHNIDRMSLFERTQDARTEAAAAYEAFLNENPVFKRMTDPAVNDWLRNGTSMERALSGEYLTLKERLSRLQDIRDKPVIARVSDDGARDVPYTADESANIVREMEEQNPMLREWAARAERFHNDFMREWAVGSGLMSGEQFDRLREKYPHYVQTYRVRDTWGGGADTTRRGSVNTGSPIREAVGDLGEIIPFADAEMMQVNSIVKNARRNELFRNIYDFARANPAQAAPYVRILAEDSDWRGPESFDDLTGSMSDAAMSDAGGIYTIRAMVDGKPVAMQVNSELYAGLQNLLHQDRGASDTFARRTVGRLATGFKRVTTGDNPFFALTNLAKDAQTAYFNTVSSRKTAVTYMYDVVRSAAHMAQGVDDWKAFSALGGKSSTFYDNNKGFEKSLASSRKSKKGIRKALNTVHGWVTFLNENAEAVWRFNEYRAGIDRYGDTPEGRAKAIQAAADVTTNFSRSGPAAKSLDSFVPYLNASIQGLDKTARQIKNHPFTTTRRALELITLPTLVLWLINKDDEDYQDLNNRTKDNYFCVPARAFDFIAKPLGLETEGKFLKIPKSREYGVAFGAAFERALRAWAQGEDMDSAFRGLGEQLMTNLAPSNPVTDNIFADLVDLQTNRDFAGRAIVPERMQGLSPENQYDYSTSGAGRAIASLWNATIGQKLGKVAPIQVDYLIDSNLGIVGDAIIGATTQPKSVEQMAEEIRSDPAGVFLAPLVNTLEQKFVADPMYQSGVTDAFYDELNAAELAKNDRNLLEGLDADVVTPEEKYYSELLKASSEMSELRKQERALMADASLTDDEREKQVKAIRRQINDIAKAAPAAAQQVREEYEKTYVPEISHLSDERRADADEAMRHGVTARQFADVDKRLKELTGEEDESGDRVRSAAEARGMALDEVMQDGTLKDSEKQAIADYVLISSMSDTEREKWNSIAKGKVQAGDFLRFKSDVSGYEEAYKNTGADNAANVAAILRGYEGLDDEERDVLFQTYSKTMKNNPFHVSEYEQRMQDNGFFGELNADGKAAVRSLANEYEQAVREGKDLEGSWMGKAYMAKEAGISPETYILFRTALEMNDYDGNGSYKNTEIEYAVKMLPSLTDSQRAYLWQSANGKDSTKNNPWGYAKVTKYQSGVPEAINPVANGTQTSAFGPREAPTAGASTEHMGLDIGAAEGEPVKAILSGKVVSTGYDSGGGYFVQIDHGDGRMSTYMHMKAGSTDGIHVGDEIGQGQQIGAVGSTGVSNGPHLDIRITQDGKYIDPLTVIPGYGIAPSGYVDDGSHSAGVMASGRAQAAAEEAAKGSGSSGLKPLPTFKGLKKLGF